MAASSPRCALPHGRAHTAARFCERLCTALSGADIRSWSYSLQAREAFSFRSRTLGEDSATTPSDTPLHLPFVRFFDPIRALPLPRSHGHESVGFSAADPVRPMPVVHSEAVVHKIKPAT